MNVAEAIKKLGIEEYGDRIFNSNSRGELFYLYDYIAIAKATKLKDTVAFTKRFKAVVKFAEDNWDKPESVFQHILKML